MSVVSKLQFTHASRSSYSWLSKQPQILQSSKLVEATLSCAELGTAQPQLVLFYLILFYFILFYLNLSYFILSYLVSICFIAWQPIREIFLSKILDGQRDKQKDPTVYRVVLQLKRLQVYKPIVYDKLSGYPVVLE